MAKRKRRQPGRPKATERVIGPVEVELIAEAYLQQQTWATIAKRFGVSKATIQHHLNATIRPAWASLGAKALNQEIARVNMLERYGWDRFFASQKTATRERLKKVFGRVKKNGKPVERLVERLLTTLKRDGNKAWLEVVRWCIDWRSKVCGHYEFGARAVQDTGVRVAGKTPSQVDIELVEKLAQRLMEKRRQDAAALAESN